MFIQKAILLALVGAAATVRAQTNETASEEDGSPLMTPSKPPLTEPYVAPTEPKYNYAEVMHKSYLFYHSQKSGHLPYQRLAWRSHSCKNCIGAYGEDLSQGWYEAANTMKWGLPYGFTATQLAYNIFMFGDAMKSVDELAEGLELMKWGAGKYNGILKEKKKKTFLLESAYSFFFPIEDYLINAHHNDTHFVGQLGVSALGPISKQIELDVDFNYWGPPEEYEDWVPTGLPHTAFYSSADDPASEIAGEYGAAMAATAAIWREYNSTYADELIDHSIRLFKLATEHPGSYTNSSQNAFEWATFWYPSTRYEDEIAWNAGWLYAATKDPQWLEQAKYWYQKSNESWYEYSWDEKGAGMHVLMYTLTKDEFFYNNAVEYFDFFLPGPKQQAKFTPRGLAYVDHWGSVGYSGNIAFLMLAFAKSLGWDHPKSKQLTTFAIQQINYALGDYGYSWVVG